MLPPRVHWQYHAPCPRTTHRNHLTTYYSQILFYFFWLFFVVNAGAWTSLPPTLTSGLKSSTSKRLEVLVASSSSLRPFLGIVQAGRESFCPRSCLFLKDSLYTQGGITLEIEKAGPLIPTVDNHQSELWDQLRSWW